ncbi:unnamed protein product [Chironomus riparius]|uniref:Uncharacterized protein n=1 Tax=Chironomus riparius TaxID=315576 RepID=A0A9N9RWR2_9DIPT|nr:unnamed protein product [Chironomus riparius]
MSTIEHNILTSTEHKTLILRRMDRESGDIDCVACGYAIKYNQRGGFTACGHGHIHYNCSYLGVSCEICSRALTFDVNQSENEYLTFDMNTNRRDEDQSSDSSEMFGLLYEIKQLLVEQKAEQAKQAKIIEELKEEIKEYKMKENKIHELQNDILQIKYDKIMKDQKDLEEKVNKLTCKD